MVFACLFWLASSCLAGSSGGLEWPLAQGGRARSLALGGALAAEAPGLDGLWLNPAALAQGQRLSASFLGSQLYGEASQGHAGILVPSLEAGVFALGFAYWQAGGLEGRDQDNRVTGSFSASSSELLAGWGRAWGRGLRAGLALKADRQSLSGYSGSGFGADLGFQGSLGRVAWGLALRNALAPVFKLREEEDRRPEALVLGLMLPIFPDRPLRGRIFGQAEGSSRLGLRLRSGLEMSRGALALRGGWDGSNPALGLGLEAGNLTLDYALLLQSALGPSHKASLTWGWGPTVEGRRIRRDQNREQAVQARVQATRDQRVKEHLAAARDLEAAGRLPEALAEWDRALTWSGTALDLVEGRKSLASRVNESRFQESLSQARAELDRGRIIEGLVRAQEALALKPDSAEARAMMTEGKRRFQDLDLARAVRRLQEQAAPPAVRPGASLNDQAVSLYLAGRLDEAVKAFQAVLEKEPANEEARKNLAKALQDQVELKKKGVRW